METEISEETLLSNSLDNFILDNYENTLTQLNSLISKSGSDSKKCEYLLYRAICLFKLGKFEDALKDLDEIEKSSNYKKDYTYYLTKGKILYYLCKFEESKKSLNSGLELNKTKANLFNFWIKKVEDEEK